MSKFLSKLPALILSIGAILRIATLGSAAIWYDEAVTLYRSTIPFWTLSSNPTDLSGALLLDLILHPLMKLSPHSLILLRLPSLVAGLISLWLVWLLMQRLKFTLEQQILTSALVAFLPGLLWMGQDARSYSLTACLFLAALWFAIDMKWLGLTACCGLLCYCHNTDIILAGGAFWVYILASNIDHRNVFKDQKTYIILIINAIFYGPILFHLFNHGDATMIQPWAPVLTGNWFLVSIIMAIWTNGYSISYFTLAALIILSLTLPLLINFMKDDPGDNNRLITLAAWLFPLFAMIVISLAWKNIILYRTLMPLLFPFCLWLGWELMHRPCKLYRFILSIGWIGLLITGLVFWNPAARGGGLDQVAAQLRSEFRPGDEIEYSTATTFLPFYYYLGDLPYKQLKIASNGFLKDPGITIPDDPIPSPQRIWFITPRDPLLTQAESDQILAIIGEGKKPFASVTYLQAATIDVWLIK